MASWVEKSSPCPRDKANKNTISASRKPYVPYLIMVFLIISDLALTAVKIEWESQSRVILKYEIALADAIQIR